MKKKTSILLLVAALFAIISVPAWATGLTPEKMMDVYIDSIYENDMATVADFSKSDDMNVTFDDTQITLPAAGENAIEIVREMENGLFDMQIGLPSANEDIALLSDRAVYKEDGYTQAVQVADGDIHIVTSVLNDEAQQEFAYDFSLPNGAYMKYADYGNDNSVLIYNEADEAIYTLVPGIVKDANGREVDFVWDLQGNTLVHGIAEGQDLAYPVNISVNAVRAYSIGHYFTSYSYAQDTGYSLSNRPLYGYKVTLAPNTANLYAVTTPPGFSNHKEASWSAVYNYFSSYSWWKNTSCMESQYKCHYNWCNSGGGSCSTWDLETWRTGNAGLTNRCNPEVA